MFLENDKLCKCLNKKIDTLDLIDYSNDYFVKSNEVDLLSKTFSNLEELYCYVEELDVLLLILKQFSKLSIINIPNISEDIHTWIQINASELNVYIDFNSIDRSGCDLWRF